MIYLVYLLHFKNITWWSKSKERVKIFAKYFSELFLLIQSLDNHVLEKLKAIDDSISSSLREEAQQKQPKVTEEDAEILQEQDEFFIRIRKTKNQLNQSEDSFDNYNNHDVRMN